MLRVLFIEQGYILGQVGSKFHSINVANAMHLLLASSSIQLVCIHTAPSNLSSCFHCPLAHIVCFVDLGMVLNGILQENAIVGLYVCSEWYMLLERTWIFHAVWWPASTSPTNPYKVILYHIIIFILMVHLPCLPYTFNSLSHRCSCNLHILRNFQPYPRKMFSKGMSQCSLSFSVSMCM